jgi:hypothetical protein
MKTLFHSGIKRGRRFFALRLGRAKSRTAPPPLEFISHARRGDWGYFCLPSLLAFWLRCCLLLGGILSMNSASGQFAIELPAAGKVWRGGTPAAYFATPQDAALYDTEARYGVAGWAVKIVQCSEPKLMRGGIWHVQCSYRLSDNPNMPGTVTNGVDAGVIAAGTCPLNAKVIIAQCVCDSGFTPYKGERECRKSRN